MQWLKCRAGFRNGRQHLSKNIARFANGCLKLSENIKGLAYDMDVCKYLKILQGLRMDVCNYLKTLKVWRMLWMSVII